MKLFNHLRSQVYKCQQNRKSDFLIKYTQNYFERINTCHKNYSQESACMLFHYL